MKKIILAGGGHGHINILKNLIKNPIKDQKIILITDYNRQYYSGMLAGYIEGIYTEEEISFDVPKLCKMANVSYIEQKIISIDKENQRVITEGGSYSYDYLSINLGSLSKLNFPTDFKNLTLVKPILNVVKAKNEIINLSKVKASPKITFIGAGASGVELALSFKAAFPKADISIITARDILRNFNQKAKKRFEKLLNENGINVIKNELVVEVRNQKIFTNRNTYNFDHAFVTSGFSGPDVAFDGFMTFGQNYLGVDENLLASKNTLAMGDVATIKKYPSMPKAGVYAIREAPILYENLLKLINGDNDFKAYRPQEKYLQIINCGNKKALANYGNFSKYGKISWMIKDKIDRDYMKVEK
ncbi:FAD-dependent oxidoreductase [Anaerococcus cruorum]|uniref:FAD-dependent oxidoreductase n=1 Tax=Anaerococcus sp. WGS1529 TaxID=3366812 RepID=UPI00372D5B83